HIFAQHFSNHAATNRATLAEWIDNDPDHADKFAALTNHPDKSQLFHFLSRLRMTSDSQSSPTLFKQKIKELLYMAKDHVDTFYQHVGEALTNCGDRVAHELDNIYIHLRVTSAGNLSNQAFADLLLKQHRLSLLDEYVTRKYPTTSESIEISLKL